MKEKILEQIKSWSTINNNHPCDDNRFFDIVIASVDQKVTQSEFESALEGQVKESYASDYYSKYEMLINFMMYLRNNRDSL